jgi:hypothetical protein
MLTGDRVATEMQGMVAALAWSWHGWRRLPLDVWIDARPSQTRGEIDRAMRSGKMGPIAWRSRDVGLNHWQICVAEQPRPPKLDDCPAICSLFPAQRMRAFECVHEVVVATLMSVEEQPRLRRESGEHLRVVIDDGATLIDCRRRDIRQMRSQLRPNGTPGSIATAVIGNLGIRRGGSNGGREHRKRKRSKTTIIDHRALVSPAHWIAHRMPAWSTPTITLKTFDEPLWNDPLHSIPFANVVGGPEGVTV